jgi:YesN/AraC family two-component response regulator
LAAIKLLWVNAGAARLREAGLSLFVSRCDVCEIEPAELPEVAAGEPWDLVCFNFDFPGMTALRLVPETKKRLPSVPIIMLTMQNSAELALWALRSRVFDLLVKPVTQEESVRCLQRVQEALQARRSQSARRPQGALDPIPAESRYNARNPPSTRLQLALAHISKHYSRSIPESEVAKLCDMTPSRFCREFKATFGMTFLECVSRQRVLAAKRLLANPDMSVTDVAAAVGFVDPSYFTRVFRKQQGISPTDYRSQTTVEELTEAGILRSA